MKITNSLWFYLFLLAAFLTCCSENDADVESSPHVGTVTPVGSPTGDGESFVAGAAGGTFKSQNGLIELTIPAGALSSDETLGVQVIENTAPNGVGASYRLTPHGLTFQKPVSVSFYYDEQQISYAPGLAIAYQDDDGIWYWPGNLRHDRTNRKVTIETTHFSDWSLFESMTLDPTESVVAPGEEVEIGAVRVFPEDFDKDLLAPLVQSDPIALGEPRPLEEKFIREWKLVGEGLLDPDGASALYVAPGEIPDDNPVTVTLEVNLRNGSRSFLLAYVSVVGCEITLNGGPYSNATFRSDGTAMAGYIPEEGLTTIGFFASGPIGDDIMVFMFYPGKGIGQEAWREEGCLVMTQQVIGSEMVQGGHMMDSDPPSVHPGYINIESYNEELGIISGTFAGNFTIAETCIPDPCITYGTIEGRFVAMTN